MIRKRYWSLSPSVAFSNVFRGLHRNGEFGLPVGSSKAGKTSPEMSFIINLQDQALRTQSDFDDRVNHGFLDSCNHLIRG